MVKLTHILLLGAYTLFQTVSALPGPVVANNEVALDARAVTITRTRTNTRTSTGRGGRVKTFTTTKTKTTTRPGKTRTTPTVTVTKTNTVTKTKTKSKNTTKKTKTKTKTTPTVTVTTTATTTSPVASAKCNFFDFGGPDYTDAAGKTYKIECGYAIAGGDIASVSGPAFGSCFALCDDTPGCKAFTWTPGSFSLPAKCALKNGGFSLFPNGITDSAVLVS